MHKSFFLTSEFPNKQKIAGQASDNLANRAGIVAANGLTSFPLIKARYKLTIAYGVQDIRIPAF